jgi:hypothetical protein
VTEATGVEIEASPAFVGGTPVAGVTVQPSARPTPGCGVPADDVLAALTAAVDSRGGQVVKAAAYPAQVPEEAFGVWEFIAADLVSAGGEPQTGVFLSAVYFLDLTWSSTIDQEVHVYAVDETAQASSGLPPPDEAEILRAVSPAESEALAAVDCLSSR